MEDTNTFPYKRGTNCLNCERNWHHHSGWSCSSFGAIEKDKLAVHQRYLTSDMPEAQALSTFKVGDTVYEKVLDARLSCTVFRFGKIVSINKNKNECTVHFENETNSCYLTDLTLDFKVGDVIETPSGSNRIVFIENYCSPSARYLVESCNGEVGASGSAILNGPRKDLANLNLDASQTYAWKSFTPNLKLVEEKQSHLQTGDLVSLQLQDVWRCRLQGRIVSYDDITDTYTVKTDTRTYSNCSSKDVNKCYSVGDSLEQGKIVFVDENLDTSMPYLLEREDYNYSNGTEINEFFLNSERSFRVDENKNYRWYGHRELTPMAKSEPKYKVGDVVVRTHLNTRKAYKISYIDKEDSVNPYLLEALKGEENGPLSYVGSKYKTMYPECAKHIVNDKYYCWGGDYCIDEPKTANEYLEIFGFKIGDVIKASNGTRKIVGVSRNGSKYHMLLEVLTFVDNSVLVYHALTTLEPGCQILAGSYPTSQFTISNSFYNYKLVSSPDQVATSKKDPPMSTDNKQVSNVSVIQRVNSNMTKGLHVAARKKLLAAARTALNQVIESQIKEPERREFAKTMLDGSVGESLCLFMVSMLPHAPVVGNKIQANHHMMAVADNCQAEAFGVAYDEVTKPLVDLFLPLISSLSESFNDIEKNFSSDVTQKIVSESGSANDGEVVGLESRSQAAVG